MKEDLLHSLRQKLDRRFGGEQTQELLRRYCKTPQAFANEILGSNWWSRQQEVAESLVNNRRVIVKSANGVGKTYLAADLALWFLYAQSPSIVLTTAPTARQVRNLLWEEIRRRHAGAKVALPGEIDTMRLDVAPGWFALGLATDEGVRFQGFHAENLLIIFDEASGVPDEIWDAAEGVAVGTNNRILAIGNPLFASGRFYEIFGRPNDWFMHTISALEHPNVTGMGKEIPGAVTTDSIDQRIREWTEETADTEGREPITCAWRGRYYRPNNLFRTRVLGEFPDSDSDSLIQLSWIEAAIDRKLCDRTDCSMAVDVARFGGDNSVIGVRQGNNLVKMQTFQNLDTMALCGRIVHLAFEKHPDAIYVDGNGLGGGVVDRLREIGVDGVIDFNAANAALDSRRFINHRAELYWQLRERFRIGEISIPDDTELKRELAAIRYGYASDGRIKIESKNELKKREHHSPDRADMLSMLFADAGGGARIDKPAVDHNERAELIDEMRAW